MRVFICGDSLAMTYSEKDAPQYGWGQVLDRFLPSGVTVCNHAWGGRSSKSFIAEGRLLAVEKELRPGDLLLAQFGHNDNADIIYRRTYAFSSYQDTLRIYVNTAREHGAIPVLLSPLCQRVFDGDTLIHVHGDLPRACGLLARDMGVRFVDTYALSHALVQALGAEKSKQWYMHVPPGLYPRCPDGLADNTHTQLEGALAFAKIAAEGIYDLVSAS